MSNASDLWPKALMNTYGTPAIEIASGHGSTLVDSQGKEYLDLLSGIAVNSLGYAHPDIVKAVSEQIATLGHTSNLFITRPVVEVAEKLKKKVGDDSTRAFFCNSGGEANEAAFKIARSTGRSRILAAVQGFHGRTMGSLALTGQPDKQKAFRPLPAGVEYYPYGDIGYLRTVVEINPEDTAAIFLEPIQGETGVIPAPDGFLQSVRKLCDEYGILMVVDEVQTGVGRTGDFFAYQHEDILPDVITMAKGIGAGMPLGVCLARGEAAHLLGPGSHGTTFGGNPVSCAAANVVLDTIDEDFCTEVRAKGKVFSEQLRNLEHVVEVRGRGLMLGVVLDSDVAKKAVTCGHDLGIVFNAPAPNVLRLVPPLIITAQELERACELLGQAVAAAVGKPNQN